MKTQVFIFNWPGKTENARHIQRVLSGLVHRVFVINCDPGATDASFLHIDKDAYYGEQFSEALKIFDGDILIQIQADAIHADWPLVVKRISTILENDLRAGIVAPSVDYTYWETPSVEIAKLSDEISLVVNTDCIVWGFRKEIASRLQKSPLHLTPLGYGIDWLASITALQLNYLVVRDHGILIHHPRGKGYSSDSAVNQMNNYIGSLSLGEQQMFHVLQGYALQRRYLCVNH